MHSCDYKYNSVCAAYNNNNNNYVIVMRANGILYAYQISKLKRARMREVARRCWN